MTMTPGREYLVSTTNLRKSYAGRPVLGDLSLHVVAGEVLGLVGRNGAGKTTAVEILQGLRSRDGGDVQVAGYDPGRERHRLRGIVGAQLQSCALPDRMRVDEALRLFARLAGDVVDWRELRSSWGLTELGRTAYASLSGGERQRVFIALALVNRPRLVFLDELTQNLDPAARLETWRHIARIRDQGTTVVLVTHDMDEAERLCDRVVVVHEGRVAAEGTPADLAERFGGPARVSFSSGAPELVGLDGVTGVHDVTHDGQRAVLRVAQRHVVGLAAELARRGLSPSDFAVDAPRLDDVFLAVTEQPLARELAS